MQVPDVKWEDVGSLGDIREELNLSICEPILHPAKFAALGLSAPTGVLLYGPPDIQVLVLSEPHLEGVWSDDFQT